ncbi:unnamed protein product [Cylicocyclus nassatus]|uniref:Uncharacterized protein n=1 Tax=Cylicocyclus nassatus TaxID=53992 RepID=A0AA36MEJ9_CYLNA|nr:unnamed protein product [Cylicocyclus nassatus]
MRGYTIVHVICVWHCAFASKAENRLYRDLLNNYNKLVRPVRNPKDSLKVEMKVFLQQIVGLDGKNQIIELNAWLKFIWIDYRLSWDRLKYENVTSVRFAGGENQIWRPDVLLYNSANEDFDSTFKSNEVVYNTGEINWVPPGILRASCKMDITYFPFDEQICYLKFGSWTYNKNSLDLRIIVDGDEASAMDLSTYIPSGEWNLISAPAVHETFKSLCCPEPYSTVTFYMVLRRRAIFHMFNIVLPTFVVSLMTIIGFCLPAHDMSEKIGYQTTILLSICFFVTIVSEVTPSTSESVPLLGMFFSTLTLIVSVSTTFTISVLHLRYRQPPNARMSAMFHAIFLELLPKITLLRRPRRLIELLPKNEGNVYDNTNNLDGSEHASPTTSLLEEPRASTLKKAKSITEQLYLERKVGDGILGKKYNVNMKRTMYARQKAKAAARFSIEQSFINSMEMSFSQDVDFTQCYFLIHNRLRKIRERAERMRALINEQEDWKFAALALDRLCLIMFTFLIVSCVTSIVFSSPYFDT